MRILTQTRASARALVGAASAGAALGLTLLAVSQTAPVEPPDLSRGDRLTQAGLRGPIQAADGDGPDLRKEPKLVRASFLPEAPGILPSTPIPYTAFRKLQPAIVEASERDVECLTRAVYFESRGDSDAGLHAVAQVVVNRSRHPAFPKSICGVVNQGLERRSCQFSFVCRPTKVTEPREWRRAREVAERALAGETMDAVGTSTFFHAARINPGWAKLTRVGRIGNHVFYRYAGKRGAASTFKGDVKPSLIDSFAGQIQAALSKPGVQTATDVPTPILGPTVPAALSLPPVLKPALPAVVPVTPVVQPPAAPAEPVLELQPAPVLQLISSPEVTPTPAASAAS